MKEGRADRFRMTVLSICVGASLLVPRAAFPGGCDRPVAEAVSVQGSVQALRAWNPDAPRNWQPVRLRDAFCPGDTIRVPSIGRADLLLVNETLLRLDQNTTVKISGPEKGGTQLLDLLVGAFYFITRTPRKLDVNTPFVNAGVEGTEFLIKVERDRTFLSVFEGKVLAANPAGTLRVGGGQSAVAEAGKAPVLRVVARPRDAVQWTLYYPAVFPPPRPGLAPGLEEGWETRAALLLSVGRVEEARSAIEVALRTDPRNASAHALLSVIAVVQNKKEEALAHATKAVEADPRSASARIALSYALQARFDLQGARESLREAVKAEPGNALAWARLAEMHFSFGDLDEALKAARRAAGLSPEIARTHVVLGFAFLAQVRTKDASAAFEKAIVLDQADPLPRLGLGLARIREGDLPGGRREIEIAASLDPQNSLIRSYLGKAYYEEKRDKPALSQLEMAKELDSSDPTPFFYDAIRKQTLNRPVEALHDLQKSIELNDNRAVYRSRLLLDEDLAARSASLGRIYGDLGFQQLALVEGWKSVNVDPGDHSAHRFLADSYSALPRHEIARVSELLQSQLLQPLNITPVQPQLAQGDLFILSGAGPSDPSFNEFNPLFNRDRLALQASGVAGSHRTVGDDLVFSGVQGPISFSAGQFHFETDGFRPNNDQKRDIYSVFLQGSLSHKTSLQGEFRSTDFTRGSLALNFDPDDFLPRERQEERRRSARLGLHHAFSPGSDLIGSLLYGTQDNRLHDTPVPVFEITQDREDTQYGGELQHLTHSGCLRLIAGAGHFTVERRTALLTVLTLPPPPPPIPPIPPVVTSDVREADIRHTNAYAYALVQVPASVTWTLGASADFFRGEFEDINQLNPKFGVSWSPRPGTTLRGAVFRLLRRTLPTSQTIEPTQVAGFNQFFDDMEGTKSWRYGAAVDRKFREDLYGGAEFTWSDLDVPVLVSGSSTVQERSDWTERVGRAYLYWTPHPWMALRAEYMYERIERDPNFSAGIEHVRTHRFPLGINAFHPSGLGVRLKGIFIHQDGSFQPRIFDPNDPFVPGSDRFWLFDGAVSYRFPERRGIVTLEGKNLFDRSFNFKDTDPVNPAIQPKRAVFLRVTLAI
ncbi:MAG: TonB-dependent receptor [Deltaproteobacteria bacterium]|nr:TonB-dependent receptor [Deltaproteobacteria bacterium]